MWLYLKTGRLHDILGGYPISGNLVRPFQPYRGETLVFPIPAEITDEMFNTVAIWCTGVDSLFSEADLNR